MKRYIFSEFLEEFLQANLFGSQAESLKTFGIVEQLNLLLEYAGFFERASLQPLALTGMGHDDIVRRPAGFGLFGLNTGHCVSPIPLEPGKKDTLAERKMLVVLCHILS